MPRPRRDGRWRLRPVGPSARAAAALRTGARASPPSPPSPGDVRRPSSVLRPRPAQGIRLVRGPARLVRGAERLVDAGVDGEHLREAGDPEDLEDALLGAHQAQRALVGADALEAADEHTETGGVEEVDVLHVHDEVVGPAADEVDELFAQLGGGVDVDLAAHLDDGAIALGTSAEGQVHVLLQVWSLACDARRSPRQKAGRVGETRPTLPEAIDSRRTGPRPGL